LKPEDLKEKVREEVWIEHEKREKNSAPRI
jgi:hypothetical protein